ncbi:nicotinamide n-methyltransferase [Podospora fimiseda]|uniref:Nicotinamide n-methyltransferase n=1 Tax=Podospora fimiseda TaxID=252190 RepID=A0AAN7BV54_9PEZI|nr:nicotinamide n-methyltransferase [Podospora fimiseda]
MSTTSDPESLLQQLQTNGYVIIPSILSSSQLEPLIATTRNLISLARQGKWPHVRTVGKQFPPWDASLAIKNGIWGVQHLLHPNLPVPDRSLYTKLYFHPILLNIASTLLQCSEDELVMELFNLLVDPPTSFSLSWHRDDIPAHFTPEQELEVLGKVGYDRHTQYNSSLVDGDESLVVVPGSHRRARTEEEKKVQEAWKDGIDEKMSGELVVKLNKGDVVFYDNNILHRGVYKAGRERMTVHGSVGHVDGAKGRARNVLQHGIGGWVGDCDFGCLGEQREMAEGMRKRLMEMGSGEDVGYSLEG